MDRYEKKTSFYTAAIFVFMIIMLVWGLFRCQEAQADYWHQNASLLPGMYMLVDVDLESTLLYTRLKILQDAQGISGNASITRIGEMIVFEIDAVVYTTKAFIEYLNADPQTTELMKPILFRQQTDGTWVQLRKLPCKWMRGDMAL